MGASGNREMKLLGTHQETAHRNNDISVAINSYRILLFCIIKAEFTLKQQRLTRYVHIWLLPDMGFIFMTSGISIYGHKMECISVVSPTGHHLGMPIFRLNIGVFRPGRA